MKDYKYRPLDGLLEINREEINSYVFIVRDDKRFIETKVLPSLQAGYVLSFEEMKDEFNKWMEDNL